MEYFSKSVLTFAGRVIAFSIVGIIVLALCFGAFMGGVLFSESQGIKKIVEEKKASIKASIDDELVPPNDKWVELYGNSEKSKLYYNIAALRVVLNQHAKVINDNRIAVQGIEPTTP